MFAYETRRWRSSATFAEREASVGGVVAGGAGERRERSRRSLERQSTCCADRGRRFTTTTRTSGASATRPWRRATRGATTTCWRLCTETRCRRPRRRLRPSTCRVVTCWRRRRVRVPACTAPARGPSTTWTVRGWFVVMRRATTTRAVTRALATPARRTTSSDAPWRTSWTRGRRVGELLDLYVPTRYSCIRKRRRYQTRDIPTPSNTRCFIVIRIFFIYI